jgi:hypothetical protein
MKAASGKKVDKGIHINRGQLVTNRKELSERTGISEQSVRTCLDRLKSTSEITTKSTNKYTVVTLCNYDYYQGKKSETNQQNNQQTNQQLTNNQPATNQQDLENTSKINGCRTPKNRKNRKNSKKEESQQKNSAGGEDFIDKVIKTFTDAYQQEHGIPYVVTSEGKERTAAGKLLALFKMKQPAMGGGAEALEFMQNYFRACLKINDRWLHDNMSLSIIVSKFNEIELKLTGGAIKQGTGATPEDLAKLVAKQIGVINPLQQ